MVIERPPAAVLWLTGLSGAGKSTIAGRVYRELCARAVPTELLDGDAVRLLSPAGFSRAERDAHVTRVGFLASRLEHHGVTSVCALISPYADARSCVRQMCRRFIEVYIATPLAECEKRDIKGLYARARRGDIESFTGISDPYEPPVNPEITLDTTVMSLDEAVGAVMAAWAAGVGLDDSVASAARQG